VCDGLGTKSATFADLVRERESRVGYPVARSLLQPERVWWWEKSLEMATSTCRTAEADARTGGNPSYQNYLMSFSLLSKRCEHLPLRVSATSVRYSGRKEVIGDPQKEILRRVLYPANIRNRASPVGTWRPDVSRVLQRAIPSVQAHETIERAWLLHKRHTRWKRNAELERKFECMRKAMAELEIMDPRSYTEANRPEDPRARSVVEVELAKKLRGPERRAVEARIRGLFPRELRPPPDTPPQTGWNYDWKPIVPPTTCEPIIPTHPVCPSLISTLQHKLSSLARTLDFTVHRWWSINYSLPIRSNQHNTTAYNLLPTLWPHASVWIHHAHLKPRVTFRSRRILRNNCTMDSPKGLCPALKRCISFLFQALPTKVVGQKKTTKVHTTNCLSSSSRMVT